MLEMRNFLPKCFGFSDTKHTISHAEQPSTMIEELCHRFSFDQLRKATNNFDQIIGRRHFGSVYKGCVLINGEAKEVAIKRLGKTSCQSGNEFKNEIVLLCQLHHPNLVSLVGFCYDKNAMIIVYEYLSNGSLFDHLHPTVNYKHMLPLSWKRRLEICIGAAHGLHYLHTGTKYTIFHRDVKSSNILLDENWVARIADFGVSMLGPVFTSKHPKPIKVDVVGTFGYMAKEYRDSGEVTEKVDVFSFGVVLLEVACGKQAPMIWTMLDESTQSSIPSMTVGKKVNYLVQKGNADEVIDPFLKGKIAPECWNLFIDIADRCLLLEPTERPHMGEVEVELERALQLQEEADAKLSSGSEHSLICNTGITSQPQQPNNEGLVATHSEINPCQN